MACCLRHQAITWTNVDLPSVRSIGIHLSQGWQVLDDLGKNRLKPPVKTAQKKQVLDTQNGQNWSKL